MARPWRIQYKDAYYHVLSRGNEGRAIFYDDQDRRIFLDTLGEASDRFGSEILAFVLMTNYHVLLQTPGADLSRVMQWVGVTKYASGRHHRRIPQQRGIVGRGKAETLLRRTFGDGSKNGGRLYGKKKEKEERDLWVFLLRQTGYYTNGEIGEMFGISYTAVSHIVKEAGNQTSLSG